MKPAKTSATLRFVNLESPFSRKPFDLADNNLVLGKAAPQSRGDFRDREKTEERRTTARRMDLEAGLMTEHHRSGGPRRHRPDMPAEYARQVARRKRRSLLDLR